MKLAILFLLNFCLMASAETALERKSRLQQELMKSLTSAVPVRTSDAQNERFANSFGPELGRQDIKAMRSAIQSSACNWRQDPSETIVVAPNCAHKKLVKQCIGEAVCSGPLSFGISANCFVGERAACPQPKDCALQADFTRRDGRTFYDDVDFRLTNPWMSGTVKDVD